MLSFVYTSQARPSKLLSLSCRCVSFSESRCSPYTIPVDSTQQSLRYNSRIILSSPVKHLDRKRSGLHGGVLNFRHRCYSLKVCLEYFLVDRSSLRQLVAHCPASLLSEYISSSQLYSYAAPILRQTFVPACCSFLASLCIPLPWGHS
jgi:hypothetical protein